MPRVTLLSDESKLISPKERAALGSSKYRSKKYPKPMDNDAINKRCNELFSNGPKSKRNAEFGRRKRTKR